MSARLAELGWAPTPMGELTLRRRRDPLLDLDVYEVKLGEEFLMSSLFTVAETALARLGLAACDEPGDVLVGGLGLGFTALAVLEDVRVRAVRVVEAFQAVITWHEQALIPPAEGLVSDHRTSLVHGDFFAMAASEDGFDRDHPGRAFDVILLDVDHSPRHLLHPAHASFYTADGLWALRTFLRPTGAFALWSDDPPDEYFLPVLREVFADATASVVAFENPLTGGTSANTVYVARG